MPDQRNPWDLPHLRLANPQLTRRERFLLKFMVFGDKIFLFLIQTLNLGLIAFVSAKWWNLMLSAFLPGVPNVTMGAALLIRMAIAVFSAKTKYNDEGEAEYEKSKNRSFRDKLSKELSTAVESLTIWGLAVVMHWILVSYRVVEYYH